jgi:hypothetical protein
MKTFFKLILAFAPWLLFLIIAQGSFFRLELGLVLALAVSVVMGLARLHRGVILWTGLLFFTYANIAVLGFSHMWTIRHMGILANGALAASSWLSVAIGKPFSLDYAKSHTDPSRWEDPVFIRTNLQVSSVWSLVFSVNAVLAWGKMAGYALPEWIYEGLSYVFLIGAAGFTSWYPNHVRRKFQ